MKPTFLVLLLLLSTTAFAKADDADESTASSEGGVSLVLNFARGPGPGYSDTAVVIPMISLEACEEQGEKISKKNKKRVNSMYWCVEETR